MPHGLWKVVSPCPEPVNSLTFVRSLACSADIFSVGQSVCMRDGSGQMRAVRSRLDRSQ